MRPPTRRFQHIVSKNLVKNCPIESCHIQAADDTFGPNIGSLKGKTRRRTVPHVYAHVDPVPPPILEHHRAVTLCIDLMFVNKIPFFITISRDLRIGTVSWLRNRQIPTIQHKPTNVITRYKQCGFTIDLILGDDEFDALTPLVPKYSFNICTADEHIPEIENYVKTIKNPVRSQ